MTKNLEDIFGDNSTTPGDTQSQKSSHVTIRQDYPKEVRQKVLSKKIQTSEVEALERLVESIKNTRNDIAPKQFVINYPEYPEGPDPDNSNEKSAWIPGETRLELYDKLLNNVPLTIALSQLNILQFSFNYWKNRAEDALIKAKNQLDEILPCEVKYVEFIFSINSAIETSKEILIRSIKMHGSRDWRANAWLLERRSPEFVKALPVQKVIVQDTRTEVREVKTVNDDIQKYKSYLSGLIIEDIETTKQIEY